MRLTSLYLISGTESGGTCFITQELRFRRYFISIKPTIIVTAVKMTTNPIVPRVAPATIPFGNDWLALVLLPEGVTGIIVVVVAFGNWMVVVTVRVGDPKANIYLQQRNLKIINLHV